MRGVRPQDCSESAIVPTDPTGFAVQLDLRLGLLRIQCREIEYRLEEHAKSQGLVLVRHPQHRFLTARGRAATAADQAALIDRMVHVPGLVAVRVGPLVHRADADADVQRGEALEAHTGDPAVMTLTLLYRAGRIAPALYLQVLADFPRRARLH